MLSGHDPAISPMHLPPLADLAPGTSGRSAAAVQQATAVNPDERFLGMPGLAGALGISLPSTAALGGSRGAGHKTMALEKDEETGAPRRLLYAGIAAALMAAALGAFFLLEDTPPPAPTATGMGETTQEFVVVTATGEPGAAPAGPTPGGTDGTREEAVADNPSPTPPALTSTAVPPSTPTPTATAPADNNLPDSHLGRDGMSMLLVPAGQFLMGSTRSEVEAASALCLTVGDNDPCGLGEFANEMPQRSIYLDAFYIDETEISNDAYRRCVAAGACDRPDYRGGRYAPPGYYDDPLFGDYPVVHVRWDQARAYCGWAGARLPTEAEWEKAARGTEGFAYPWGNQFDPNLANTQEGGGDRLRPAGSYPAGASPYGVLDMAGSLWEWVEDWFDPGYYSEMPDRNPPPAPAGTDKVLRGGGYSSFRHYARTTNRGFENPNTSSAYRGFRCALAADRVSDERSE